ncbi:hypothetical protein MJO29_004116 [Puccinia striiformis f. sp. tritici]|nr:hypothetical protein MJO29_004116 [Puccinia striiformis f. sp. tritici]
MIIQTNKIFVCAVLHTLGGPRLTVLAPPPFLPEGSIGLSRATEDHSGAGVSILGIKHIQENHYDANIRHRIGSPRNQDSVENLKLEWDWMSNQMVSKLGDWKETSGLDTKLKGVYDYLQLKISDLLEKGRLRREISKMDISSRTHVNPRYREIVSKLNRIRNSDNQSRITEFRKNWSGLKECFIYPKDQENEALQSHKVEILLGMFRLSDFVRKYADHDIITPELLESIQLSQPDVLKQMVHFYLEFKWRNAEALSPGSYHSVAPTLQSLTSSNVMRPFKSSIINALGPEGQRRLVHDSLKTMMDALKAKFYAGGSERSEFITNFDPFFMKIVGLERRLDGDYLSSTLGKLEEERIQKIQPVIQYAIKKIQKLPQESDHGHKSTHEFMFSYYFLDYIKNFDREAISKGILEGINMRIFEKQFQLIDDIFRILHDPVGSGDKMKLKYYQRFMDAEKDEDLKEWSKELKGASSLGMI